MKGSKGQSHSNSGKQQQQKAMPVSQAEPLFPRVHVNDTRNGPKAPPRNKMALYEQLTVPSHHFPQSSSLQSSGSAWSAMNPAYAPQYSPYAGNFAPWVVFSAADGVPGHSTLASQKSALIDSGAEKELQTVPRVAVPLSEVTFATAAPSNNVSSKDFSNKRARHEDDFAVPTYCFPKGGSGKAEPLIASRTLDDGQGEPRGPTNEAAAVCQQSGEGYTQTGQAPGFFYPQREHTGLTSRGTPGTMEQVTERICSSESTGKLGNRNDDDFSETLHQEHDSNPSLVEPDVNIAARDVIGAAGEQEFWKIRKNLLRQQHIFTLQIFELHRLVKVQQLLAESPSLLLEADTDNVALPEPSQPGRIESSEDCREIQAQALKQPSNAGEEKLKASKDGDVEQRNNHATARHETPSLLNLSMNSAGVPGVQYAVRNAFLGSTNSWAYGPYPVNQWTMLPTSGAYPYVLQPSAPTPVGYNAAYQPVFGAAPGAYEMFPMVSATAPRQRQADISVYYQHALPPGHHWQPPMFCNSAIPSVPSPWYAFPQYYDGATMSSAPGHGPDVSLIHQQQQQQQQHQQQQQYQHQQQHHQQQQYQHQQQHQQQQQHQHQQQHEHQQQHQHQQQQQHQHQQQQQHQHLHLHQQRQQQHQEQQRDNEGESAFQRFPKLPKEVPSSYNSELSSERTGILQQQVQERDFPQGFHNTDRTEGAGDNNVRCAPIPFSFSSSDERQLIGNQEHGKKVAPRPVMATLESAAGILKSIQRERR